MKAEKEELAKFKKTKIVTGFGEFDEKNVLRFRNLTKPVSVEDMLSILESGAQCLLNFSHVGWHFKRD